MAGVRTAPEDWPARLRRLVFQQFQSSNWAIPLANAIGEQRGKTEGLIQALILLWSIDPVTADVDSPSYGVGRGVQLDRIGKLVGQPRSGADDDTYRPLLRARILANRSSGTPDEIILMYQAMLSDDTAGLQVYEPGGTAQFSIQLLTPIADTIAEVAAKLLRSAKLAGVRAVLLYQESPDEESFYTETGGLTLVPFPNGSTSITVQGDVSADFPASGTLHVDNGDEVNFEDIAYTSLSVGGGNTTFAIPGGLANDYDAGAVVALVGSVGLGFPAAVALTASRTVGQTSALVTGDVSLFPSSGDVIIDPAEDNEETIHYTGIVNFGPTLNRLDFSTGLVSNHDAGAVVLLTPQPAGVGGDLAGALKA